LPYQKKSLSEPALTTSWRVAQTAKVMSRGIREKMPDGDEEAEEGIGG
jgi:hypothetical protein